MENDYFSNARVNFSINKYIEIVKFRCLPSVKIREIPSSISHSNFIFIYTKNYLLWKQKEEVCERFFIAFVLSTEMDFGSHPLLLAQRSRCGHLIIKIIRHYIRKFIGEHELEILLCLKYIEGESHDSILYVGAIFKKNQVPTPKRVLGFSSAVTDTNFVKFVERTNAI